MENTNRNLEGVSAPNLKVGYFLKLGRDGMCGDVVSSAQLISTPRHYLFSKSEFCFHLGCANMLIYAK